MAGLEALRHAANGRSPGVDWLRPNGASGKGDSGAISVNAAPLIPGGKFRTIETIRVRGMEFEAQAAMIINMLTRYNVQHIGIDGAASARRCISS